MLWNVGNIKANAYWENQLKEEKAEWLISEEKKEMFINDKYVHKIYTPKDKNAINPVELFQIYKKEGKVKEHMSILSNAPKKTVNIPKIPMANRNKTPEPTKSNEFDWNQATKIMFNNSDKQKMKGFGELNEKMFKKPPSNFSQTNLKKPFQNQINNESKKESSEEFENFKAVSKDLRSFLLAGNPLDKLKMCDN